MLVPIICGGALAKWSIVCSLGFAHPVSSQVPTAPETIAVVNGPLRLRALLWRPAGTGPFPAVLFNHGSYTSEESAQMSDPVVLGPVFARRGYVFLLLFRQGVGLSRGQGTADGDLMARASSAEGVAGRNRVQLALMEGEELDEARAALAILRARADVDARRIAVVGHSFGGSLSLFLAARDTAIRAAVVFGAAAGSWAQAPELRQRLLAAVGRTHAAVLLLHPANDYSVASGKALAAELLRLRKPHELKIYPPYGTTPRQGHNFLFHSVTTWESDVFDFLAAHL